MAEVQQTRLLWPGGAPLAASLEKCLHLLVPDAAVAVLPVQFERPDPSAHMMSLVQAIRVVLGVQGSADATSYWSVFGRGVSIHAVCSIVARKLHGIGHDLAKLDPARLVAAPTRAYVEEKRLRARKTLELLDEIRGIVLPIKAEEDEVNRFARGAASFLSGFLAQYHPDTTVTVDEGLSEVFAYWTEKTAVGQCFCQPFLR